MSRTSIVKKKTFVLHPFCFLLKTRIFEWLGTYDKVVPQYSHFNILTLMSLDLDQFGGITGWSIKIGTFHGSAFFCILTEGFLDLDLFLLFLFSNLFLLWFEKLPSLYIIEKEPVNGVKGDRSLHKKWTNGFFGKSGEEEEGKWLGEQNLGHDVDRVFLYATI